MPGTESVVQVAGKEQVVYREGKHGFRFDARWGVRPRVLYVPTARGWDDAVPEWLRGRRDEVLAYLARESDHSLVETDDGYSAAERDGRSLEAVGDAETARSIADT